MEGVDQAWLLLLVGAEKGFGFGFGFGVYFLSGSSLLTTNDLLLVYGKPNKPIYLPLAYLLYLLQNL
jgi:formate/nitrite transporter FocA (FNT family)